MAGTRTSSKNDSEVSDDRCPSFSRFLPRRKPGRSVSTRIRTHASRTAFRRGPRDYDHEIAHLPVRDEGLLPRDHKIAAIALGAGANALQVASGTGFRHGDRANGVAGHHSRQPLLLLFGASVTEQITTAHVTMDREIGRRTREAGVAEFLDDDRVIPKVSARAAELFGNLRAEQAGLAAGVPQRPVDDSGRFPPLKIRRNLRCRKAPHRLPELVVLLVVDGARG